MGKLDNYVCDGQMDIFDFLQQDIAPEPKSQKKIYEPECCESCIHHIYGGGCELKSKPDHGLCKDWMLDNRPAWMGFLLPQEAIKELFLSDLIYESIKEQLEKIYSKDGNQEERIEKISSLKGLCGQAYYLSGNQLEELEPYHHHIIGYASNHTYGITIKQMDAEGHQLEFGRYLSWQEVDDALKDLYSDKLVAGKWVKEHGKRILFDDIQEGKYYIADYSTASHDWFKVVYVKEKVDDALHYVDAPKGVRGYWTWGSNYSALARKQWVDGEDRKQGWWYEVENICQHSQHSCNKEELWKVAEECGEECPHTCCRSCEVIHCGARCNGSKEPEQIFKVDVRGLCDDGYCPKCNLAFMDNQTDIERCPDCGIKLDWSRWHEMNEWYDSTAQN